MDPPTTAAMFTPSDLAWSPATTDPVFSENSGVGSGEPSGTSTSSEASGSSKSSVEVVGLFDGAGPVGCGFDPDEVADEGAAGLADGSGAGADEALAGGGVECELDSCSSPPTSLTKIGFLEPFVWKIAPTLFIHGTNDERRV